MSASAWGFAAFAALVWLSVRTDQGKVFGGSTEEGLTMWAILSVVFGAGMMIGMHYEKEEQAEYRSLYCEWKGRYMICETDIYTGREPEYGSGGWRP